MCMYVAIAKPKLCALAMLVFPILLCAQTGQIHVEVKDPSGASMAASGKLQTPKSTFSFQTDPRGNYTVSDLPPGRYRLEVSKAGFVTQSLSIDLAAGTSVSRILTLPLSSQSSSVE